MSPVNHPAVIETICNSLRTTDLHEVLDFNKLDKFDNLCSIRGAAVHNTLLEFQDRVYKSVQFSPASLSATEYKAIQTHNLIIHDMHSPRETDFDSDYHLANLSLAGCELTQTDLYSVILTAWLIPVECTCNEPNQKSRQFFQ
jgi:hypothetical protein